MEPHVPLGVSIAAKKWNKFEGKGSKTSSQSKETRDERLFSIREEDEGLGSMKRVKRGERCDDGILPGTASDPILWRLMIPRFDA